MILGSGATAAMVLLLYKAAALALLIWEAVQRQMLLDGVELLAAGEQETELLEIPTDHLSM